MREDRQFEQAMPLERGHHGENRQRRSPSAAAFGPQAEAPPCRDHDAQAHEDQRHHRAPPDAAAKTPDHLRHQKRGPDRGQPIFAPQAQQQPSARSGSTIPGKVSMTAAPSTNWP
jgi:hypothetical protein